ncbi:MAG: hypothetical protein VXW26_09185, partial [SAR324 cluster bacterium]|nr:hypothetical protein [SAR324 cluster bacterium]
MCLTTVILAPCACGGGVGAAVDNVVSGRSGTIRWRVPKLCFLLKGSLKSDTAAKDNLWFPME